MTDWTLVKGKKPEDKYPCSWEWWTRADMEVAVQKTLDDNSNFRNIPIWKKYAAQKRVGDWGASPLPVIIDPGGRIVDGLNRMRSDLDSGVEGRWYLTVWDWPVEEDSGIDRNKPRNNVQWFRKHASERQLNNSDLATIKWALRGGVPWDVANAPLLSPEILLEALEARRQAFDMVMGRKVKGFIAPMRGAFVRAHGQIPDIEEAFQMVLSGDRPDHITVERFSPLKCLIKVITGPIMSGMQSDVINYRKTASALHMWGKGEAATKLYGSGKELLPVKALDAIWKRVSEEAFTKVEKAEAAAR